MKLILPIAALFLFGCVKDSSSAQRRFYEAVKRQDAANVRLLLQDPAVNINEKDASQLKWTALHHAVEPLLAHDDADYQSVSVLYMLMTHRDLDPNLQDHGGNSPLHLLSAFGCPIYILQHFLQLPGLNFSLMTDSGHTPITLAKENNSGATVYLEHAQKIKNRRRQDARTEILPFLLATHPRVGSNSPVQMLCKHIIEKIGQDCMNMAESPESRELEEISSCVQRDLVSNICSAFAYSCFKRDVHEVQTQVI